MKIMLYRFDRSITLKPGTLGKVMEIAPKMSECAKKILGDDMGEKARWTASRMECRTQRARSLEPRMSATMER